MWLRARMWYWHIRLTYLLFTRPCNSSFSREYPVGKEFHNGTSPRRVYIGNLQLTKCNLTFLDDVPLRKSCHLVPILLVIVVINSELRSDSGDNNSH